MNLLSYEWMNLKERGECPWDLESLNALPALSSLLMSSLPEFAGLVYFLFPLFPQSQFVLEIMYSFLSFVQVLVLGSLPYAS